MSLNYSSEDILDALPAKTSSITLFIDSALSSKSCNVKYISSLRSIDCSSSRRKSCTIFLLRLRWAICDRRFCCRRFSNCSPEGTLRIGSTCGLGLSNVLGLLGCSLPGHELRIGRNSSFVLCVCIIDGLAFSVARPALYCARSPSTW
jgi:hypothetical protein